MLQEETTKKISWRGILPWTFDPNLCDFDLATRFCELFRRVDSDEVVEQGGDDAEVGLGANQDVKMEKGKKIFQYIRSVMIAHFAIVELDGDLGRDGLLERMYETFWMDRIGKDIAIDRLFLGKIDGCKERIDIKMEGRKLHRPTLISGLVVEPASFSKMDRDARKSLWRPM
jgi:hypothetical protein